MMNRFVETTLYFIVGTAVGATASYFITKKVMESRLEQEVTAVKNHYATKRIKESPDYKTIQQQFVNSYEEALGRLGYTGGPDNLDKFFKARGINKDMTLDEIMGPDDDTTPSDEETEKTEDARFQELVEKRDGSQDPYVISIEEFMEDEPEYEKITLTYFDEDDTLITENESVVPDVLRLLGNDALTNFGVGSKDKNIVYVRNPRTESDLEVVLDERSYMEVVLGEPPVKSTPMKMREDFE